MTNNEKNFDYTVANMSKTQQCASSAGAEHTANTQSRDQLVFYRRIRRVFRNADRICMFLAGLVVATAVYFFVISSVTGLLLTVLGAVALFKLSNMFNKACRSGRYSV